ncbi:MAG: helix-turn-helix domain-containing protein [Steroidobacteraceae bacterium]
MSFRPSQKKLNICVDFEVGSRFGVAGADGQHPVHDTVTKTYQHLNFFQHECELSVRVPRVKLPDGKVVQVSPPWAGKLSGFSLLFERLVLLLSREMSFTGVRAHHRGVGSSDHGRVPSLRRCGGWCSRSP